MQAVLETPDLFSFHAVASAPSAPPPEEPADTLPTPAPKLKKKPNPKGKVKHLQFKHRELPEWAVGVLEDVTVEEKNESFHVFLHCGTIAPERYALVNEVLVNIGGKWKGPKLGHIFSYDPSEILLAIQQTRKVPEKNPLDFFPTPKALIRRIVEESSAEWIFSMFREDTGYIPECRGLEPSAGAGNIIEVLTEMYPLLKGQIDAVEANPFNAQALRHLQTMGTLGEVFEENFLDWTPPENHNYRIAVMNPPFAYKGNSLAYIDHILHMWEILKGNREQRPAVLISITPTGWVRNQGNQKLNDFRNLVALYGNMETLPDESFAESGTKTPTCAIILEYNPTRPLRELEAGHASNFLLLLDNSQEHYRGKKALLERIAKLEGAERMDTIRAFFFERREKMLQEGSSIAYTPGILEEVAQNIVLE